MKVKYREKNITNSVSDPLVKALLEIGRLKSCFRQGWLKRGVTKEVGESIADHCFFVVLSAMMIADRDFPELDKLKLIRMAIVHELAEATVGDITPVDGITEEEKYLMEQKAFREILKDVDVDGAYLRLWEEFEKAETPEAKFIKQIDKFEMGLQAYKYAEHGFSGMDEFLNSTNRVVSDDRIKELLKDVKIVGNEG